MKKKLFLQEIVDDLLSVFAISPIRYMHPVGAFRVVFPYQLVKLAMALDPLKPPLALCHVAIDAKVCRLAAHVLRGSHTTHSRIQRKTPVPTANLDGMNHRVAQRLEHLVSQRTEVDDVRLSRLVPDALRLRRRTRCQFLQREILTDIRCHIFLFYFFKHKLP